MFHLNISFLKYASAFPWCNVDCGRKEYDEYFVFLHAPPLVRGSYPLAESPSKEHLGNHVARSIAAEFLHLLPRGPMPVFVSPAGMACTPSPGLWLYSEGALIQRISPSDLGPPDEA